MRILITGGSGFIASRAIPFLAREFEVFSLGRSPAERSGHIVADLTEAGWEQRLPSQVDAVLHLAQSSQYRSFPEGAGDMVRVNVEGTFRLLEWARGVGVQRFIFASSGNVYSWGDAPLTEASPTKPESFYGATKLAMETLSAQYAKFFPVLALRLFTVYGPGQEQMILIELLRKLIAQAEITIGGGSGPTFSPLAVSDCCEFLKRTLTKELPKAFTAVNLSGQEILSIRQIVETYSEITKIEPRFISTPDAPKCFASKSSFAHELLDYKPQMSFREGAKAVVETFMQKPPK